MWHGSGKDIVSKRTRVSEEARQPLVIAQALSMWDIRKTGSDLPLLVSGHLKAPRRCAVWVALALVAGLTACAKPQAGAAFNDPYEAANRRAYESSKRLDQALLRPIAVQVAKSPPATTQPIVNFADNLGLPSSILNGVLQGDLKGAAGNTARLLLNTTLGLGGLLDPASDIGLNEKPADFGQTLAVWGVPEGAYLFVPVLGPSTERDAFGDLVDFFIDPFAVYAPHNLVVGRRVARVEGLVIDRGRHLETVDSILYDSADGYAQSRLLYLQNRRYELGDAAGSAYVDPYADPYAAPSAADATPGFADPYAN